ncbi:MAG TPA: DUF2804 domain-containing protein [Polyangiaceae bacterium]|nr:DUF2804 domain-containing protein [Polyangiaceae bacterium]
MTPNPPDAPAALPSAPPDVADDRGAPRFGTYAGELGRVELGRLSGRFQPPVPLRPLRRKRWHYAFVATNEVALACAVVDLGYAANAFVVALDLGAERPIVDLSMLGLPGLLARVNDRPAEGAEARFRTRGARLSIERAEGSRAYRLRGAIGSTGSSPSLHWDVELSTDRRGPALTVVAPVDGGRVNVTQKHAGLGARGLLVAGARTYRLDRGVGGLDYTQGYLAYRTAWRWAFACGRLEDGTPFGFNLVEGFNAAAGVSENALWLGDRMTPLGPARFRFRRDALLEPWQLATDDGALDLHFRPLWVHREARDLKVIESRFAQPLGLFEGRARAFGRALTLRALPGVTEDQAMRW